MNLVFFNNIQPQLNQAFNKRVGSNSTPRDMKYISISLILLLLIVLEINSQNTEYSQIRLNGVYTELYLVRPDFSDGFVSINYERVIGKKKRSNLRIGIYPDFESTISFPLTITWITKPTRSHHFEYGIGAVFRIEHYIDPYVLTQSREWFYDIPAIMVPLMYRYQKSSGWFLRGGINLFLSWPTLPSPSFSFGYKFQNNPPILTGRRSWKFTIPPDLIFLL